jgi:hypothetical protein
MVSFGNPKKCWKISQNVSQTCPKRVANRIPNMSQILSLQVGFPKQFSQTCPKQAQVHPIHTPKHVSKPILGCLWDAFGTLFIPLVRGGLSGPAAYPTRHQHTLLTLCLTGETRQTSHISFQHISALYLLVETCFKRHCACMLVLRACLPCPHCTPHEGHM